MGSGKLFATAIALIGTLVVVTFLYVTVIRGGASQAVGPDAVSPSEQHVVDTAAQAQQSLPTATALAHLRRASLLPAAPSHVGLIVPLVARFTVSAVLPTRYNTTDGLPPGEAGYATTSERWLASAHVYPVVFDVVEYLRGESDATGWITGPSQTYTQGVALDDGRIAVDDEMICFFTEMTSSFPEDPRMAYLLAQAAELTHDSDVVRAAELAACYEVDGGSAVEVATGTAFTLTEVLEASDDPLP